MDWDALTGLPIGELVKAGNQDWPPIKQLTGRYVRLEPLDAARHGDDLWAAVGGLGNAALWQYLSEGPFALREDFDQSLRDAAAAEDPAFFAIIDSHSSAAVGRCALLNMRPPHRSVEVGALLFSPRLQRSRAATEAFYLLAKYVFDELAYRRYEWKCNALNAKSILAAGRLGFVFEGTFRQHMIIKGRNRDSAWFSMLSEEWPGVRSAMEKWLDPANFDAEGKQRQGLSGLVKQLIRPQRP